MPASKENIIKVYCSVIDTWIQANESLSLIDVGDGRGLDERSDSVGLILNPASLKLPINWSADSHDSDDRRENRKRSLTNADASHSKLPQSSCSNGVESLVLTALSSFMQSALHAMPGIESVFNYYDDLISRSSTNSTKCAADDIARNTQRKLGRLRELIKAIKKMNDNDGKGSIEIVDYSELQSSVELLCDRVIAISKGAILVSAGTATLLPPRSRFVWGDVRKGLRLMAESKSLQGTHSIVVGDPPWPNRSVRRAGRYQTMRLEDLLALGAHVGNLSSHDAILALWVTNDPKVISFVKSELFPSWGFRYVQTWYWLKVGREGRPVCGVSLHRLPLERVLIGVKISFDGINNIKEPIEIEKPEDLVNFQYVDSGCGFVPEHLCASSGAHTTTTKEWEGQSDHRVSFPVQCFASAPLRHSWKPNLAPILVQARHWLCTHGRPALNTAPVTLTPTSPPPVAAAGDTSGGGICQQCSNEELRGGAESGLRFLELFAR